MTVWKNPCLLCGCGISIYWPLCRCECHKGNAEHRIAWNNEKDAPAEPSKKETPKTE